MMQSAEGITSASSTQAHLDIELLRGAQQNAADIVVLILSEPTHKRILTGITLLSHPLQIWRGTSAKMTRPA